MEKILLVEDRYGPKSNHLEDDDMIDRLNNRITVMVLVMCILILAGGVLVGKQINCWTPGRFILNKFNSVIDYIFFLIIQFS